MNEYDELFKKVLDFHGHSCPGITYGYRVSLLALEVIGDRSEDEEMVAIVENNSCAVDAVQVITGCTFGKGNLIFKNFGKQTYTFLKRPSGTGIKLSIKHCPMKETREEKEAWKAYLSGNRSENTKNIVNQRKARKIDHILSLPADKIMSIEKVTLPLPQKADIYPSVQCHKCNEKIMESLARVKNGNIVCIPCSEYLN